MSSLDHPGLCRRVPRTSTSQPCGEAPVTRALAKRQRSRAARAAVRLCALRAALLVGLDLSCGLNPSGCPFPIFCSSGTDGLDGPPTGRRAAAGELNYTLNWVGFDNFYSYAPRYSFCPFQPIHTKGVPGGFPRGTTRHTQLHHRGDRRPEQQHNTRLAVGQSQVHMELQHHSATTERAQSQSQRRPQVGQVTWQPPRAHQDPTDPGNA